MEFFETVEKRKSIRSFLRNEIEGAKVGRLLEAINLAPSAGNLQAYRIVLAKSRKLKEEIAQAALEQDFIAQAPLVLVFLADRKKSSIKYGKRGAELYCIQDATIAASYAQLAAAALGLASVWVGAFEEREIKRLVKAQENEVPVAIIPIGYAAEEIEGHQRRKVSSMASEL